MLDPELAARVLDEALENYLADNLNAWELQADGSYRKRRRRATAPCRTRRRPALLAKICA